MNISNLLIVKTQIYARLYYKIIVDKQTIYGMYVLAHVIYTKATYKTDTIKYDIQLFCNHIQNYKQHTNDNLENLINYIFTKINEYYCN